MPRMAQFDQRVIADLLRRQHFVIGRDQALACGVPEAALDWRIRPGGPWRKLLPGVYQATTGVVVPEQREMAALLHAGPRSVLTGPAAARRYGLPMRETGLIDVVVPVGVRRQSTGFVRIQRSNRMPAGWCVDGEIRYVPPDRAVADAARGLTSSRAARALMAQAIQRQVCTIAMLAAELEHGPAKGSAAPRAALAEVRDGIRSVTEGDLRTLLKRARIPMPMFNARLYHHQNTLIAVVDAWWEDAGVAAEVDSREYHFRVEDWQRTMRRHDRLVAHGVLLLHFTPRQIRADPAEVTTHIRAALDAGRGRSPLAITTRPAA